MHIVEGWANANSTICPIPNLKKFLILTLPYS